MLRRDFCSSFGLATGGLALLDRRPARRIGPRPIESIDVIMHRRDGCVGEVLHSNGFPFPRGMVYADDLHTVRLLVHGESIPVVMRPLAGRWHDGSLKFAQLLCRYDTPSDADLADARLVFGDHTIAQAPAEQLMAMVELSERETSMSNGRSARDPAAVILPSSADYLVTTQLGGLLRTRTVSDTAANLPSVYADFDTRYPAASDHQHQAAPTSLRYDGGGYDRAWNHFAFWVRSGDVRFFDRGLEYGNGYYDWMYSVAFTAGFIHAHHAQPAGNLCLYWLTGSDDARTSVIDMGVGTSNALGDRVPFLFMDGSAGNPDFYWEGRVVAKVMQGCLFAWAVDDAAGNKGEQWSWWLDGLLDRCQNHQHSNGYYATAHTGEAGGATVGQKQFMEGLRMYAMLEYLEMIPNPRRTDVETLIDRQVGVIDSASDAVTGEPVWNASTETWKYLYQTSGGNGDTGIRFDTLALNNLVNIGHAILWEATGTTAYRNRLDETVIAAYNDPVNWWQTTADYGIKFFNQSFYSLFNSIGMHTP